MILQRLFFNDIKAFGSFAKTIFRLNFLPAIRDTTEGSPEYYRRTQYAILILAVVSKWLFLCIFLFFSSSCFASARGDVKKGNRLYDKRMYDEAFANYQKAFEKYPNSDIINFNIGNVYYRKSEYKEAVEHFQKALLSQDDNFRQRALYNLGNAEYKYAMSHKERDPQRAVSLLQEALRHYERSLEIDPSDEDARFNYEFVKKEMERLKEEIEKQSSRSEEPSRESDNQDSSGKGQDEKDSVKDEEEPENKLDDTDYGRSQQAEDESQGAFGQEAQEMSREQALMLLESYGQNEEPGELYRGKIPMRKLPDVLKDW